MLRPADERPHATASAAGDTPDAALGPDALMLKARYKGAFEAAIRKAMATLPARDRMLLLMHFVDGLTLLQLAAMQKVSRATVTRWLSAARESLREGTRRYLEADGHLTSSELQSIAALVTSQLEISIARALREVERREPTQSRIKEPSRSD
jgi:RNA polymerase sigma-70 factor (ECF subfamily)